MFGDVELVGGKEILDFIGHLMQRGNASLAKTEEQFCQVKVIGLFRLVELRVVVCGGLDVVDDLLHAQKQRESVALATGQKAVLPEHRTVFERGIALSQFEQLVTVQALQVALGKLGELGAHAVEGPAHVRAVALEHVKLAHA